MQGNRCITHSAWLGWHSPTLCLESFTLWLTKPALPSTGHIPHGCANAIYLPYVIQYNAHVPTAMRDYAEIARRMGLPGTSEQALVNSLCEKINDFNRRLNIPKTLKEFGIDEEEFKSKLPKIAELAVGDACTGSNPRPITPAEMEKLLTCTYYGTEVDF